MFKYPFGDKVLRGELSLVLPLFNPHKWSEVTIFHLICRKSLREFPILI